MTDNETVFEVKDVTTARGIVIPVSAMEWTFDQSGGPGGQHVNKSSTRATLVVSVALLRGTSAQVSRILDACGQTILVTSRSSRSQWRNRQECLKQAADVIDASAAPPPPVRRKTRPTRGSVERRLESKRRTSEKKKSRRDLD